jgi:hypothetical protein
MENREVTIEDLGDLPALTLGNFTAGLPAWLVDWFLHSNDPKAIENRRSVREHAVLVIDEANKRQAKRFEAMKEEAKHLDPKADIRPIASIDPVIAQDLRNRYGSECLNDRKFLEDCRKKAPQLFFPK